MERKSIVAAGIVIVLLAAVVFFLGKETSKPNPGNSQEASSGQPSENNGSGASDNNTTSWQTYSNNRYGYTIKYPEKWYMNSGSSENDFTESGGQGTSVTYIGGETTWSNYPEFYSSNEVPEDWQTILMTIYKTDKSLDDYFNSISSHVEVSDKTAAKVQGKDTIRYSISNDDGSGTAIALVKLDGGVMVFQTKKESAGTLSQMISSMSFTK